MEFFFGFYFRTKFRERVHDTLYALRTIYLPAILFAYILRGKQAKPERGKLWRFIAGTACAGQGDFRGSGAAFGLYRPERTTFELNRQSRFSFGFCSFARRVPFDDFFSVKPHAPCSDVPWIRIDGRPENTARMPFATTSRPAGNPQNDDDDDDDKTTTESKLRNRSVFILSTVVRKKKLERKSRTRILGPCSVLSTTDKCLPFRI